MNMLVEYEQSPVAIGTRTPHFFWEVSLSGRGRTQSAFHILVASSKSLLESENADIWNSGKVVSSQSANVAYAGIPLCSNQDYYWTVKIWDESDESQGFAPIRRFGTALFEDTDWKAQWIGMGPAEEPEYDPYSLQQKDGSGGLELTSEDYAKMQPEFQDFEPDLRAPLLRTEFTLERPVSRARAFVCGLGLYELRINGSKVGDDVLATPRTDFRKRVLYQTYDITPQLNKGSNAAGVMLGNGWYNGQKKRWHWQNPWFGSPRALVQLVIEFEDGSQTMVCSDASWSGDWSPLTFNCIYDGEDYDARLEQDGWDTPGFDSTSWRNVNEVSPPGGRLVAMDHQPNRVMQRFSPVSITQPKPGIFVYDVGTIMTGWTRLAIQDGIKGETINLRYAELLHDDGMINTITNCKARQADRYVMKGDNMEEYEPRFTYHGFRYVEVTGYPGKPTLSTLEACFVHQGVKQTGNFECGNELVNKIHACTLQSQKCNLQMGVPTDDTQREERLGWCGDAWSYALESFYNLDTPRFWNKWIADFHDQQDEEHGLVGYICPLPGWGEDLIWSSAFIFIPWWHYLHYGDMRILEKSYPYLKKYLAYLERVGIKELPKLTDQDPNSILYPECGWDERYPSPENHGYLQHSWFADHLATNEGYTDLGKDHPRSMATAFYHQDALTMANIAETLGHVDDADTYRRLASNIKETFNTRFLNPAEGHYDNGCQSMMALGLSFDLVPQEYREKLIVRLNRSVSHFQRRITSGYAGTKWVVHALSTYGRNDFLWERVVATEYPSWGHMLGDTKTTITESWDGGWSQCHTTLGAAIDEWFYWGLAGIRSDPSGPGFEKIIFRPYLPKDLPWARASLDTARGTILSHWTQDNFSATLKVVVPANSTAMVYLPTSQEGLCENGRPVTEFDDIEVSQSGEGNCSCALGSGDYQFSWEKVNE